MTTSRLDLAYGRRGGHLMSGVTTPVEDRPRCKVCDQPMTAGQRGEHHLCRETGLAGQRCTCPPECTTDSRIGDGPRGCAPDCRVCIPNAGRLHKDVIRS